MGVKKIRRKNWEPPRLVVYYASYADAGAPSLQERLAEQARAEGLSTSALCVKYLREGLARAVLDMSYKKKESSR